MVLVTDELKVWLDKGRKYLLMCMLGSFSVGAFLEIVLKEYVFVSGLIAAGMMFVGMLVMSYWLDDEWRKQKRIEKTNSR